MDPELIKSLQDVAFKKLEILIKPTSVRSKSFENVKKTLQNQTSHPFELYLRNSEMIARFETISAMDEVYLKLSDKEEELGFKAELISAKPIEQAVVGPEDPNQIDISEEFPIEAVADFMAKYSDHTEPIHPIHPIQMERAQRRKVIKSDPDYCQLKKFRDPHCNGCWAVKTIYKCVRANKPYCSIECWTAAERANDEVIAAVDPKLAGCAFVLVSFSSARDLCLRRVSDSEIFIRNMNQVAGLAEKSDHIKGRCPVGSWVMARYKDNWYRGVVTKKIGKTLVRLLLTDLGYEETFLIRQLKKADSPKKLEQLKCTVIKCTLDVVLRDGISFGCEELFDKLMEKEEPLIATNDDLDRLNLKVGHAQGRSLSDVVNEKMTMTMDFNGPSYLFEDLPVHKVERRENVPMLVTDLMDSELGISLAHAGYFQKCYQYEEHFQEFPGKIKGNYTPTNLELCLVKMPSASGNTRWLRAVGLRSCGDRFPRLELLDYGTVVKASIADIRKLPKELLYAPAALAYAPMDENCSKVDQVLGWIAEYRRGVHAVLIDKIEPADEKHCHPRFFCPNMSDKIQQKRV